MKTFNTILIWISTISIPLIYYKGLSPDGVADIILCMFCSIFVGYVVYKGSKQVFQ